MDRFEYIEKYQHYRNCTSFGDDHKTRFKKRFEKEKINIPISFDDYIKCKCIIDSVDAFGLDRTKFYYFLLFVSDYCENLRIVNNNSNIIGQLKSFSNILEKIGEKAKVKLEKLEDEKPEEVLDKEERKLSLKITGNFELSPFTCDVLNQIISEFIKKEEDFALDSFYKTGDLPNDSISHLLYTNFDKEAAYKRTDRVAQYYAIVMINSLFNCILSNTSFKGKKGDKLYNKNALIANILFYFNFLVYKDLDDDTSNPKIVENILKSKSSKANIINDLYLE